MATTTKKQLAFQMVDTIFSAMRESLIGGQRIEIRGFGVFQAKETRAKPRARNPRTGAVIHVPARRKTHFRPGKMIRQELHRPVETAPAVDA